MVTFSTTASFQFMLRRHWRTPSMVMFRITSPVIGTSGNASRKTP